MSQLQILTNNFGNFRLNVIAFSSPIFGSINGTQTKKQMQWYPIKSNQPEIEFEVQFASEKDYETFQEFVQNSQKWSLNAPRPMVHLNWPERNINNWSGIITQFEAGGRRADPAPKAKFTVYLFDNFIAQYTEMASLAPTFSKGLNIVMGGFQRLIANPYGLRLPWIAPSRRGQQNLQGQGQQENPAYIVTPTTE